MAIISAEPKEKTPNKPNLGTADYLLGGGCCLVILAAGLASSVLGVLTAGVVLIGAGYLLARREPPDEDHR